METVQVLLFILVFLVMVALMFSRKIPALIALPIMAFLIPLIGGVPVDDIVQYVIGHGAIKLHRAYTVAIFGSMLSVLLQKTGVAENFIKIGAELAGDNPWMIAALMLIMIAALFTTLGGLGAVIMVGTIILPIMSSIGIGPLTTVGVFLFGFSIGGILNVGNWAVYVDVLGMSVSQIRPFALIMFGIAILVALTYLTIQLYRDGHQIDFFKIGRRVAIILIIIALIGFLVTRLSSQIRSQLSYILSQTGHVIKYLIGAGIIFLVLLTLYKKFFNRDEKGDGIFWPAYFTPILPLLLILLFNMRFISAFVCGLIFGFLSTYKKGRLNMFIQSIFKGGGVVMPAVVMFFG
ncbi:MAG TPA: citrate transporter, partial [bacterium]|nr:citrate transporter [bacterium]